MRQDGLKRILTTRLQLDLVIYSNLSKMYFRTHRRVFIECEPVAYRVRMMVCFIQSYPWNHLKISKF